MSMPLISIITPAYQAEQTIKRAVVSALQQSYADWELIIVSDDQQDYGHILKEQGIADERLRFFSTGQIGSGSSMARNHALRVAQGQYIACLDADDELKPAKLATLLPLAQKYGAAISDIEFRDHETNVLLEQYNQLPCRDFATVKQIIPACIQSYSVYLYDRFRIPDLYYDPDLLRAQDFIYLMSFFNAIDCVGVSAEKLHVYYRRQGSSFHSPDTHQKSHEYKLMILEKLERGQHSIHNPAAQDVARRYMEFSLEVDRLYDEEILHDPQAQWLAIFKSQLPNRFLSTL